MHNRNDASQQSPGGRQPRLQHPADGGAHERGGDQDAEPGVAEQHLAGSEHQPLGGKVHGHIGGLHGDVDGFKMSPHRRGGVGQSAQGEGVCREQEAEIVGDKWQRNGADGENGETQQERGHANGYDHQAALSSKPNEGVLDARKPGRAKPRECKCRGDRNQSQGEFDERERSGIFRSGRHDHTERFASFSIRVAGRLSISRALRNMGIVLLRDFSAGGFESGCVEDSPLMRDEAGRRSQNSESILHAAPEVDG